MNNKGFTLIELIATIALLAVIALISFVSINEVLSQSEVSDCENLISSIKSATKEYVSDNRYDIISTSISTWDLVNNKYLTGPIVNPFNNKEDITNSINIIITLKNDYTVDTITIENASGNVIDCGSGKW